MRVRSQIPAYQRIAIDIAHRIYNQELKVGQKLYGRSTLASEYSVSPETVRKAIKILEDVDIVKSTKGSGVVVISRENAYKFMNRFSNMKNLLNERKKLDTALVEVIDKIIDYTGKLRNINPLAPVEIEVPETSPHIGKTIGEVNFWHNTGGTIVAIKRNDQLIVSPGPFATFESGDILFVIGNDQVVQRVTHFLNE